MDETAHSLTKIADDAVYAEIYPKLLDAAKMKRYSITLNYIDKQLTRVLRSKGHKVTEIYGGCSHHFCGCGSETVISFEPPQ